MGRPVKVLRRIMDSEEFGWWQAYQMIEPFGPRRDDERAGVIAAIMAEINRDRKQRSEPFHWTDFFPPFALPSIRTAIASQPTHDQLKTKLFAWAAMMNAANRETPTH